MKYLHRYIPGIFFALYLVGMNQSISPLLVAPAVVLMLFLLGSSTWIYLLDRKEIRILLAPEMHYSRTEIILLCAMGIGTVLFVYFGFQNEPVPGNEEPLKFAIIPTLCVICYMIVLISFGPYLYSLKLLDSGLRPEGISFRKYPWDHFKTFEIDIPNRMITFRFLNDAALPVSIQKRTFDAQLQDIERFLLKKIPTI